MKQIIQTPLSQDTSTARTSSPAVQQVGKVNIAMLDGVRAIAALLVVSVHISDIEGVPWNANRNPLATSLAFVGRTGVVLFFVLSGFLLFLPYARALLFQDPWPTLRAFYTRRLFRIWPGYYVTLLLMILLFARQYLEPLHWKQTALFLTFLMDSSPATWQRIDGPFWTLAIEWQFYLLLPWIALAFAWFVKRVSALPERRLKAVLCCCGGLIGWGLLVRGFGIYCQRHPHVDLFLPHFVLKYFLIFTFGMQGKYLEVFALGMIASACYTFAQHPAYGRLARARFQRWSERYWQLGWLVLIGIALWQAQAEIDRDGTPHFTALNFLQPLKSGYAWLGEPLAGVGFALCMFALLFGSPLLRWLFETRLLRRVGTLSYGLYMWHLNVMIAFSRTLLPHLPFTGSILGREMMLWAFIWLLMLPFCSLFYKVIEEPGMRLGAWLLARWTTSARRDRPGSTLSQPESPSVPLPAELAARPGSPQSQWGVTWRYRLRARRRTRV